MKILLINNNPVVSRLTALSARKEDIEIDEIQEVTELNSDTYDIVFIDAESWTKDVRDVMNDNIKTKKLVLFYTDGDEEERSSFDLSILKPFLPSEVSAVIRSLEEDDFVAETIEDNENNFDILADKKIETKDDLFDLNGLDDLEELTVVSPKVDTNSVSFDEKLEEAFPIKSTTLEDDLFKEDSKFDLDISSPAKIDETAKFDLDISSPTPKIDDDLFNLELNNELPSLEDDLFVEDKKEEIPTKIESLNMDDSLFEPLEKLEDDASILLEDSALELDDLNLDNLTMEEPKKETQILDVDEIENIKGILTEDISDDLILDDLMPSMPTSLLDDDKPKKKSKKESTKKSKEKSVDLEPNVLVETLSALPVESLRELLAGAKVNIKIKFPKSKN